jgi:cell division protein FtsI/penicillin-binding protein 2
LRRAIPNERAGHVPEPRAPQEARNASIGQGTVLATPIQVARLAAGIATGGRLPRPRLVLDDAVDSDDVELDASVLARIRAGLEGCVRRGTAAGTEAGLAGLDVAGKTGTAELGKGQPNVAWFMGYYPASSPEVAFAVVVDRTRGHGASVCAPVAGALVRAWEKARGAR